MFSAPYFSLLFLTATLVEADATERRKEESKSKQGNSKEAKTSFSTIGSL